MNKKVIPSNPGGVQEIALREALAGTNVAHALSTIMHRALPDARDGLETGAPAHPLRHAAFAPRSRRGV